MSEIRVLDCTLRDGGYINDWRFGYRNIQSVLSRLTKANIDIIECGFLEDSEYDPEKSFFNSVEQIKDVLPEAKGNTQYVAMTRFGYLNLDKLSDYDGTSINGIRVTFHEDEVDEAMEYCRKIQEKGYKVYVQPVGTTSYTDSFLLKLINTVNAMKPYAFYIVDTLGLMRKNDLLRMFYLVDNNLDQNIVIGFHSHNNLQLSFSNAQELIDIHTRRTIFIDSSVYGMGRGAGNLNTELITQHINSIKGVHYATDYLLEIIDETINELLQRYTWGYSVPYYLAAINNCHPNYATYLINKKTLPIKSISSILCNIAKDRRELYNEKYIVELYMQYQQNYIDDRGTKSVLSRLIQGREVLVLAPGTSIKKDSRQIKAFIAERNPIVISVNFDGEEIPVDYAFFSNEKRYQGYIEAGFLRDKEYSTILTSNITIKEHADHIINYGDYLNAHPLANDNATLILLTFLEKLNVKRVHVAGFDGFQIEQGENYVEGRLETRLDEQTLDAMNLQIADVVRELNEKVELNFITQSLYQVRALELL